MPREFKDYRKFYENKSTRSWAFRIHGYKCAKCGNKKLVADLVVHHRVYRNCEEKPEDVVILCKDCHIDLHRRQKLFQLTLDDIPLVDPGWKEMIEEHVATGKQKRRYCVDLKMIGLYTKPGDMPKNFMLSGNPCAFMKHMANLQKIMWFSLKTY